MVPQEVVAAFQAERELGSERRGDFERFWWGFERSVLWF